MADWSPDITPPKYGPPNMAAELYKMIRGIPQAYQEGAADAFKRGQFARTEEIQKPFVDENGNAITDLPRLQNHLLKVGGAEYAKELFPYISGKAADTAIGAGISGGAPASDPARRSDAQTPSMLQRAAAAQGGTGGTPGVTSTGSEIGEPKGEDTVNSVATEFFGGDSDVGMLVPRFAAALGIPADKINDTPLSPAQVDRLKGIMERTKGALAARGEVKPDAPGVPQYVLPGQSAALGSGGAPGQPPGQPGQPPIQTAQAGPGGQPPQTAPAEIQARKLEADAKRQEQILLENSRNASPGTIAAAQAGIADLRRQAAVLRANEAAISKEADPRLRQAEGLKEAQKEEVKQGSALSNSINNTAREFQQGLAPHLDLMRGIMNDPNLATGAGVDWAVAWNKIRANPHFRGLPGYDPNAALPNEGLRKVLAASVLNQTAALKDEAAALGGSAGRIFQQQVQLAIDASQNDSNTLPALRYLTEVQSRIGKHQLQAQELLNNYVGKFGKGVPDNNFNQELAKFNAANPLFTRAEIDDHKLIAPPVAPNTQDTTKIKAWSEHNGLKAGDPIVTPHGQRVPWDPAKMLKLEINKPGAGVRPQDRT